MLANGNETIQPLRIGLFGAGSRGVQCLAALRSDPRFVIECFFDNSPAKWGTQLEGLPIRQATGEACAALDAVVIASQYAREILAQLSGLGYTRVALSPADLVRRFSKDGQPRTTAAEPTDPAALLRVKEGLVARTPLHVTALADLIDRDSDPVPARGLGWVNETACTICCNNYFAYAMVLARSFLRHHPSGRFFIGLADRSSSEVEYPRDPRITVVAAEELGIPAFEAFAFKYDVLELNTAIKPYLLEHLFRHEGVRRVLYLDPDILVLDSLAPLFDKLADVPMVLTPHLTRPYSDDLHPREVDIMRSGTYNLGFIGLAAHDQTWSFLSWWQQRLYNNGCTREVDKGYFTDQKWIDLVPSFFPEHAVLRAPGFNAAYWNLHERTIGFADGRFMANGEPLRFFHFSGIEILDIESVSKHQNRFTLPAVGALRDLFELYRLLLLRHGHLTLRSIPYTYGRFDNGVRVPDIVRIVYRESALTGVYPHPFTTRAVPSFYDWLRAPSREGLPVTNLQATLHARMPDLRAAYPDLYGASLVGFLLYMISAAELYGLPLELSGDPTELHRHVERPMPVPSTVSRASGRPSARRADTNASSPVEAPRAVRALAEPGDEAHQVMSQSLAVAVHEAASRSRVLSELCIGPVEIDRPGHAAAAQQAAVAYWCWDEHWDRHSIGAACGPAASSAARPPREIWVPSTYALEGLSRMTALPVVKVPPPIGLIEPTNAPRATFTLPEDRFVFASLIEPGSGGGAAEAMQIARAFHLASQDERFGARAALALWVAPSLLTPDVRRAVHGAAGHAPGFQLIERPLAPADRVQFLRLADVYVSLQAWQAFDLWLAYAAWHGIPAIAAARGGGVDCATINNSLLVDLVAADASTPAVRSARIADETHAASMMTHALDAPDELRRRGTRAREDARARYRLGAIASTIQERLEQLGAIAS